MPKTKWTTKTEEKLIKYLMSLGFVNIMLEYPCGENHRCRCDCVAISEDGFSVGFEIKKSISDFNSGCGLNITEFEYNYVVVPSSISNWVIGKLYRSGFNECGVIEVVHGNSYLKLIKPSKLNLAKTKKRFYNTFLYLYDPIGQAEYKRRKM